MIPLSKSFFARDSLLVAKELLGKIIEIDGMRGRIVETESYGVDPASHAFKRTKRSELMHTTFGYVYVYLIYGMYNCLNFTTNKNTAGAVLIRAVEPLSKIETMKQRRKTEKINNLCSGPDKLCQSFGITTIDNGKIIGEKVIVFDDEFTVPSIATSSRVGIKDAKELEWRFFIKGNEFVSKVKK